MPYDTIEVKPATAAIGAAFSGVDLSRRLGNQQFRAVHDALMARQVVFFRGQTLPLDQHKAPGRRFGELHKDVPEAESRAILEFLYEHCGRPRWQVGFRWQPVSVAFWDNRCAQHIAMWDYFPQVCSGCRVTVKADRPIYRAH
jgi:alpha-ketoglutarate-dependent taurine dioxygenase